MGDFIRTTIVFIRGDIRSLDNGSFRVLGVGIEALGKP